MVIIVVSYDPPFILIIFRTVTYITLKTHYHIPLFHLTPYKRKLNYTINY